jgi:hypothetical protein
LKPRRCHRQIASRTPNTVDSVSYHGDLEDGVAAEQGGSQTDHTDFGERFPYPEPHSGGGESNEENPGELLPLDGGLECSCCAEAAATETSVGRRAEEMELTCAPPGYMCVAAS